MERNKVEVLGAANSFTSLVWEQTQTADLLRFGSEAVFWSVSIPLFKSLRKTGRHHPHLQPVDMCTNFKDTLAKAVNLGHVCLYLHTQMKRDTGNQMR